MGRGQLSSVPPLFWILTWTFEVTFTWSQTLGPHRSWLSWLAAVLQCACVCVCVFPRSSWRCQRLTLESPAWKAWPDLRLFSTCNLALSVPLIVWLNKSRFISAKKIGVLSITQDSWVWLQSQQGTAIPNVVWPKPLVSDESGGKCWRTSKKKEKRKKDRGTNRHSTSHFCLP